MSPERWPERTHVLCCVVVHVESELLQLKSAWETSSVPKGPCFSMVFAPWLVTNKGQLHSSPCISLLGRKRYGNACCAAHCFQDVCMLNALSICSWAIVSLESLERLSENLKELLEWKLAGLATAWPGRSAWQQRSHCLLFGTLEAGIGNVTQHYLIHSIPLTRGGKLHSREVLQPWSMEIIFYLGTSSGTIIYCKCCIALICAGAGWETASTHSL